MQVTEGYRKHLTEIIRKKSVDAFFIGDSVKKSIQKNGYDATMNNLHAKSVALIDHYNSVLIDSDYKFESCDDPIITSLCFYKEFVPVLNMWISPLGKIYDVDIAILNKLTEPFVSFDITKFETYFMDIENKLILSKNPAMKLVISLLKQFRTRYAL